MTTVMKLRSREREGISREAKNSASWLWLCETAFFRTLLSRRSWYTSIFCRTRLAPSKSLIGHRVLL